MERNLRGMGSGDKTHRMGEVYVVVGPPNAGKGTQSVRLAESLGAVHLSTGELLRNEHDPELMMIMKTGGLVPSDDIRRLLKGALLSVPLTQPVVIDGAKKLEEAKWLAELLPTLGRRLICVVHLIIDEGESRRRSSERGRHDDAEDVQEERWLRYRHEVMPTIEYYRGVGVLLEVEAQGSPEEVTQRIRTALGL